ncbi:hypothetical protein SAMN02910369_00028 [Lachnospiraceae bacterium NE2001]|nr:hypothetical protein SAMN02910369_00028 [Lachnospiraceae bacterium NE2001]
MFNSIIARAINFVCEMHDLVDDSFESCTCERYPNHMLFWSKMDFDEFCIMLSNMVKELCQLAEYYRTGEAAFGSIPSSAELTRIWDVVYDGCLEHDDWHTIDAWMDIQKYGQKLCEALYHGQDGIMINPVLYSFAEAVVYYTFADRLRDDEGVFAFILDEYPQDEEDRIFDWTISYME